MTTYKNIVLGNFTHDYFLYKKRTNNIKSYGGIYNIWRNLSQTQKRKTKFIYSTSNVVKMDLLSTLKIANTNVLGDVSVNQNFGKSLLSFSRSFYFSNKDDWNWVHISYLDWLQPTVTEIQEIKNKCDYLTADVGYEVQIDKFIRPYYPYLNFIFCTKNQGAGISFNDKFIHGPNNWQIGKNNYYIPKRAKVAFSLGAGDTLVASAMNTCKTPLEMLHKQDKICEDLNKKLIERDKWMKRRVGIS